MSPFIDPSCQPILDRLLDGNRRFVECVGGRFTAEEGEHRRRLADGQAPSTVILTCSDSRVLPTLVFDQSLGDLFVIRVAGNVITPEELGSVELAVEQLGSQLVIVLGHTGCGAVTAAVDSLSRPDAVVSDNLRSVIRRIQPAVESAMAEVGGGDASTATALDDDTRVQVIERAIRLNVQNGGTELRRGSPIIDELAESGRLTIIGAVYSLRTGVVEILD